MNNPQGKLTVRFLLAVPCRGELERHKLVDKTLHTENYIKRGEAIEFARQFKEKNPMNFELVFEWQANKVFIHPDEE